MDVLRRNLLLAMLTAGALGASQAQAQFTTVKEALETTAGSISLPASSSGLLTVTPCSQCATKTLRATASTSYFLRDRPVSLAEIRSALSAQPRAYVTVLYSVETNELASVTASIDPP